MRYYSSMIYVGVTGDQGGDTREKEKKGSFAFMISHGINDASHIIWLNMTPCET